MSSTKNRLPGAKECIGILLFALGLMFVLLSILFSFIIIGELGIIFELHSETDTDYTKMLQLKYLFYIGSVLISLGAIIWFWGKIKEKFSKLLMFVGSITFACAVIILIGIKIFEMIGDRTFTLPDKPPIDYLSMTGLWNAIYIGIAIACAGVFLFFLDTFVKENKINIWDELELY